MKTGYRRVARGCDRSELKPFMHNGKLLYTETTKQINQVGGLKHREYKEIRGKIKTRNYKTSTWLSSSTTQYKEILQLTNKKLIKRPSCRW